MSFKATSQIAQWFRTAVPCVGHCPVTTDCGKYVQLIADRQYEEAYYVARDPNPISSACGRVCAAPCEDMCRRGRIDAPISIRALKRFLTERYGPESGSQAQVGSLFEGTVPTSGSKTVWDASYLSQKGHEPQVREKTKDKKVAIIGCGAAGITAAQDLALLGYQVEIFESEAASGGLMRYGVPEYRIPRTLIEKEFGAVLDLGVKAHFNTEVGRDITFMELNEKFDAIFVAIGLQMGRKIPIPGHDLSGVYQAMDFLRQVWRGNRPVIGERVVVLGGGLVGVDASQTSWRIGAKEVHMCMIESFADMPARRSWQGREEFEEVIEEGVHIHPEYGPQRVIGENGRVKAVEFHRCVSILDEQKRFNPKYDVNDKLVIECDNVIFAVGQAADFSFLSADSGIEAQRGLLKADSKTFVVKDKIFAGGDVALGPRIFIDAAMSGHAAARAIDAMIRSVRKQKVFHLEVEVLPTDTYEMHEDYEKADRFTPHAEDLSRRDLSKAIEHIYTEDEAVAQAKRCLYCHTFPVFEGGLCVECGMCTEVCPTYCLKFCPPEDLDIPDDMRAAILEHIDYTGETDMAVMLKDEEKCIRCGLCAITCPTDAFKMEKMHFEEREVEVAVAAGTPLHMLID